jgi:hypothetical protein
VIIIICLRDFTQRDPTIADTLVSDPDHKSNLGRSWGNNFPLPIAQIPPAILAVK